MGNGWTNVPLEKVKSRIEANLKEGEKLCKTRDCYHKIKSQDKYCSSCQLTHYSGTYTKPCLVCPRKILKTSTNGYYDFHNKTCLGCSTRIASNQTCCSYHEICLSKLWEYKSISDIQELETFTTWFNGNCGYVISGASSYNVWVVVYEPQHKSLSETLSAIRYKDSYSYLPNARNKAQELKSKLQNGGWYDTPMLEIHPYANNYESFYNIITSPYVMKRSIPQKWEQRHGPFLTPGYLDVQVPVDNINDYAKVFDILKVCCANYEHVGVYVGNGEVCHFSKDRNGTYIDSWEDFKKFDGCEGNIDSSEATVYHPVIPFKYLKRIAEQIAWAVDNNFRQNNYDLRNRNCEHFANMCVYGINYSEQIERKKVALAVSVGVTGAVVAGGFTGAGIWSVIGSIALAPATGGASLLLGAASVGAAGAAVATTLNVADGYAEINNGKGSTIKLVNEMNESNDKFGESSNKLSDDIKANIEVPPKEYCKIM